MINYPRVIVENSDGTRVEGVLYETHPYFNYHILGLDNGEIYRTIGTLTLADEETIKEETTEQPTVLQRIKAFFTPR